jgi:hypothetical protein
LSLFPLLILKLYHVFLSCGIYKGLPEITSWTAPIFPQQPLSAETPGAKPFGYCAGALIDDTRFQKK